MLAPRVRVYRSGEPRPGVHDGTLAFAQIESHAFGDGSHPTTRLCAGAVDVLSRQSESVMDVGTGTGILARIARGRGAKFVVGTDIDEHARETANVNAALDEHAVEIVVSDRAPDHWGPRFNLVVANILQKPLIDMAGALCAALAPGGMLLLSGFSNAESPILRVAYSRLILRNEAKLDGWALLALQKT